MQVQKLTSKYFYLRNYIIAKKLATPAKLITTKFTEKSRVLRKLNSENTLNAIFYNNNLRSENNLNFENKISSNIIMPKARQRNSKCLNGLVNKISRAIKMKKSQPRQ